MRQLILATLFYYVSAFNAFASSPVFMSSEWGIAACSAWNENAVLTDELAGETWAGNNGEKDHKILHLYRLDCSETPTVELRIADQDGKAMCVYGGGVESGELVKKHDYIMYSKTSNWARMGSGKDGPMKAMMLGRLKFKGPKWEAMSNMGPFGAFLLLTGEVESDMENCP
ncbi:MAG: SCP2 sterol-binding domain-containing protein [bacterium]